MDPITKQLQPPLRAVHMSLFPSMDTLDSAMEYCKAQLPVVEEQKLVPLLMVYHNTLLKQLEK
jgi:hypothetical protein